MKIQTDLDKFEDHWREFKTQEEWNKYEYSSWYAENLWKSGTYQPRAYFEPHKFPCIALMGPCLNNPNGADHQVFIFIYDYAETE